MQTSLASLVAPSRLPSSVVSALHMFYSRPFGTGCRARLPAVL